MSCRLVIPAADYERHRRKEHGRTSRPSAAVRAALLSQARYCCSICGVSEGALRSAGEKGLELHHISGDFTENEPANLSVVCPAHNPRGQETRWAAKAARDAQRD